MKGSVVLINPKYKLLKPACYMGNISMAVVSTLSPILFITFRTDYNISYTFLGLLVLANFVTQLTVDLVFSFFSHRFNIKKTMCIMPLLSVVGFLIYALTPFFFSDYMYLGLLTGTLLFSAASGLGEVLISPIIAALPADDPEKEMSKLHSVFAWGVVAVTVYSTLFLKIFSSESWQYLALSFTVIPILGLIFFLVSDIPPMQTPEKTSSAFHLLKNRGVLLCITAIFLGGAAECTMEQWASGYLEQALGIPKVSGDILGVALFAVMLGLGRTLYSKIGKNICKVLFLGSIGAAICYGAASLTPFPVIGLAACALCGLCTSMLWPGSLIVASERYPQGGVFIYAMMAAGGDLGASVAPQLVGIVADFTSQNAFFVSFAENANILPESLGMKAGMFIGMLFALAAIPVFHKLKKTK